MLYTICMDETNEILSWRAPEHQHIERGSDWYWALGIIAVSTALTSILFKNILFALVIVVGAGTLGMIAARKPHEVDFTLDEHGLVIGDEFYPYDHMYAFWISGDEYPTLLIDTPRFMTPDLVIPLQDVSPEEVRGMLLAHNVTEKPLRESFFYNVLEFLGF
jgi:hypothetical protein